MSAETRAVNLYRWYYRIIGGMIVLSLAVSFWRIYNQQGQRNHELELSIQALREEQRQSDEEAFVLARDVIALMESGVPVHATGVSPLFQSPLKEQAIPVLLEKVRDPRSAVAIYAMHDLRQLLRSEPNPEQLAPQIVPALLLLLKQRDIPGGVVELLQMVKADPEVIRPHLLKIIRYDETTSVIRGAYWLKQVDPSFEVTPIYIEHMKRSLRPSKQLVLSGIGLTHFQPGRLEIALKRELLDAITPEEKASLQAWIELVEQTAKDSPRGRVPACSDLN
ncbi:hypothetical protein [Bremerella alba]|uniref:Uncharacterized protein n=1 Tax=Bremerella alba TaxID=980252 RepID=A0A7V8V1U5_9BACT|nr:hypothetical protein [Bremerella alba]MBA2113326.1 hypothetical protein [Bremerella alba]